ncbi:MAG: D-glycero-beta-D-manno-heptose 1,7-bisphosphate 7-phosphatase [Gammaproteobacteria bacterium]|nr:D-glycero-beta-D-manno-heptose 1,7-bisphosphate 7-phosphatase [Gammaproteobacteria bacterium]
MPKMIILDRDGVINEDSDDYIKSVDEWIPIPGSLEAINRLKMAGYLVTVATNQSGISRGLFNEEVLRQIHGKMHRLLARRGASVDGIFYCPHGPQDNCTCRKPKPGLLFQIAKQFDINLAETVFVGDSISDIRAAEMANAIPVLVRTGRGEQVMQNSPEAVNLPMYDDLAHFARETLRKRG